MAKSIENLFKDVSENQKNVRFNDLVRLVTAFGFKHLRTKGDHQVFRHPKAPNEPLNLQDRKGEAKPYQVRQFLKLVHTYDLKA